MTAPRAALLAPILALSLLLAGLLPVWALALRTPFRLVDDYGALVPLERISLSDQWLQAFALQENPIRFRLTHDLGQWVYWRMLGASPAAHHALRLLMKLVAFAAFAALARREVARANGRGPDGPLALAALALAAALFFYLPNNPEARLAPQELALVLFLLGAWFLVDWRPSAVPPLVVDSLFAVCFVLCLWSKEPAFIGAAPVLALAWRRTGTPPRAVWLPVRLLCLVAWLHAAAKAWVMSRGGGYGRAPLTLAGLRRMAAALPHLVLLDGAVPWLWLPLLAGCGLAAWTLLVRPRQERGWVPWALLGAALCAYLLQWEMVLRYAYPLTVVLSLVAVVGFTSLAARGGHAHRWAVLLSVVALAVAVSAYGTLATQFSVQHDGGLTEQAALQAAEQATPGNGGLLFLPRVGEYQYRAGFYFTHHLPRYAGRTLAVKSVKRTDVPVGGLVLARGTVPEGFEVLATLPPPDPPRALRAAEALSRWARFGRPAPLALLDAGAPDLPLDTWYVARRAGRMER